MTRTFLATLEFDGTRFVGWQRQREGRTVQQELEKVLERLAGGEIRAHAAGRTDAGVHALGMGVSFALPARWTPDSLQRALNALLPSDCFVAEVREARPEFHARTCAAEREYEYRIGTDAGARSPFREPFEWDLALPLDLELLEHSSRRLIGEHDFLAVSVRSSFRPHTRCRVRLARWEARSDHAGVRLRIAADRFLHHMVRMLVGTMVEVALGRRPETDMDALLAQDPAVRTSPPAPAQGLYFVMARYPEEWFLLPEVAA
ncbi:MAG: tRNA pseudouridine(38-40) synthase TruA [Gemmatimonadota bacterium]